ncbi:MAG: FliO/MopB family protein [Tepidisphaerales bacterium]
MRAPRCVILLVALLPLLQGAGAATRPATQPAAGAGSIYDGKLIGFRSGDGTRNGATKADKPADSSFGYARWILSLGAVLGLIFSAKYAARQLMGVHSPAGGGAINVLCRQNLAPRQQLLLIQVGRRVVLVANAGAQMNTLAEVSDPDEIAEIVAQANKRRVSAAASFGSIFGKAADAYEARPPEAPEGPETPAMQPPEESPAGAELSAARNELSNLLQKVRLVSSVAKRS